MNAQPEHPSYIAEERKGDILLFFELIRLLDYIILAHYGKNSSM